MSALQGIGVFFLMIMAHTLCAAAEASTDTYHQQHQQGWHWYQNPPVDKKSPEALPPTQHMQSLRTQLQQSLDTAILKPTTDNVKNFLTQQQGFSNRASRFANVWQQVLLENPALNYSLQQPTNAIGNQVYVGLKRQQEDAAIEKLGKRNGLFFFYTPQCPYCQKFAPILKQFAQRYKLTIMPITLDEGTLPEFPHSLRDRGQAKQFQVKTVPAVFTVNPYTGKAYPVAYGLVSESELRINMLNIVTQFGRNTS